MAERSFAREVQQLRLAAGQEFRDEGILTITKALLENSVGYVTGYQSAPISHLMDVFADASDILAKLGVHFKFSSNKTAAATLATSVMYPVRGAVTFKSTAGTNVACDALSNMSSGGVTGGALVILGEDYGEGSSIMQKRSHTFAMKSQLWLLDPRPNLPSIVPAVEQGFALSEASNTLVMLEVRIHACHVHSNFITKNNQKPPFSLTQACNAPQRDTNRIVLPPASFAHKRDKVARRWPTAVDYIRTHDLNEVFDGDLSDIGIILQDGLYNGVLRGLMNAGLADIWGTTRVPLYVLNVTYPLVDQDVVAFCHDKSAVLIVEEDQPDFIEQALSKILRDAESPTCLIGKRVLPMAGGYTAAVLEDGLRNFIATAALDLTTELTPRANAAAILEKAPVRALAAVVPTRSPASAPAAPSVRSSPPWPHPAMSTW